ncbi:hypothetical protein VNO78_10631 [Psophocarpus tetragonolobus]|uniref:Uncharacterized protein n=1 Tax=Psophocarpus tetragonolobus TaxID=3891 RepID=A0AAN9SK35_PSOTE
MSRCSPHHHKCIVPVHQYKIHLTHAPILSTKYSPRTFTNDSLPFSFALVHVTECKKYSMLHEDLESAIAGSDYEGIKSIMAEWESALKDWLDGEVEATIASLAAEGTHEKRDLTDSGARNGMRYDDVDSQGPNKDAVVLWKLNSLGNMGPEEVAGRILTAFSKVQAHCLSSGGNELPHSTSVQLFPASSQVTHGLVNYILLAALRSLAAKLANTVNSVMANECPHLAAAFAAFGSMVLDGRVTSTHNMRVAACRNLDANANAMFQWYFKQNMSADLVNARLEPPNVGPLNSAVLSGELCMIQLVAHEGCEHGLEHHEPSEMRTIQSVAYEGCEQIFENHDSRNVRMLDSLCQLSIEPECEVSLKEVTSVSQSQYNENVGAYEGEDSVLSVPIVCGVVGNRPCCNACGMEKNRRNTEVQAPIMNNGNDLYTVPIFELNALMVGGAGLMLGEMRILGDVVNILGENSQRDR